MRSRLGGLALAVLLVGLAGFLGGPYVQDLVDRSRLVESVVDLLVVGGAVLMGTGTVGLLVAAGMADRFEQEKRLLDHYQAVGWRQRTMQGKHASPDTRDE